VTDNSWLYRTISATEGSLQVGPLPRLEAEGLGALLRRALLRHVPGSAVSAVRLEGAAHELALLDGVVEDALEIVENLRRVRLSRSRDGRLEIPFTASGPATVTAADLAERADIQVANPDLVIATVNEGGQLDMAVEVTTGTGYRGGPQSSEAGAPEASPDWLPVDCSYGPVAAVAMEVEGPDGESTLTLRVRTNGTVNPEAALTVAASQLEHGEGEELKAALQQADGETPAAASEGDAEPAPRAPRDLSKSKPVLAIPDLLDLPRSSYERFLQTGTPPSERGVQGLEKLLDDTFPLTLAGGEQWVCDEYSVSEPEFDAGTCQRLGRTYAGGLSLQLRATATGATASVEAASVPLMTERGTFVIKGREKVVATQLPAQDTGGRADLTQRRARPVDRQLEEALAAPLARDVAAAGELAAVGELQFAHTAAALEGFFAKGASMRPVEGTNPLAVLSQARMVVQQGVGRSDFEARDAHMSHFGRLCPLETPEGERIGVNLSAALYARFDEAGELLTPYLNTRTGAVEYLTAAAEAEKVIADAEVGGEHRLRYGGKTLARRRGEITRVDAKESRYAPVHPSQTLGASSCLIPFLSNDDANRALMATNMHKQAVPLVQAEAPLVRTGLEEHVAASSGGQVRTEVSGTVFSVSADAVTVREPGSGEMHTYLLAGYSGTAAGTCWRQRATVRQGDAVAAGQVVGAGPCWDDGVLALGRNLLVGYMSWEGANFEDGLVVSDRLVKEGVFTSIKVRQYTATITAATAGEEALGQGHLDEGEAARLSPNGLIAEGAEVEGGDVLIARARTTGGETTDGSVRLPDGQRGTVTRVEHYAAARGDALDEGVAELARVTVAVRRRLSVGDKLANRHGAKGIVARIVPEDQMPVLPDGRTLDLLASPLGVPSRMNLGQLLETHAGLAAQTLNCTVVTPGFGGGLTEEVQDLLAEAGLPRSGMLQLRDGRTGHAFEQETTVGCHYYMKLNHMAGDKLRARNNGCEGSATGAGANGHRGMRVGIMETWALQAYGVGHILQEMQTCKADDEAARRGTYEALVSGTGLPGPTVPESVRRLVLQLRGLCLDLRFRRADGEDLDVFAEGASVDEAASLLLRFADADVVRSWSAGPLREIAGAETETGPGQAAGEIRHLELAAPVPHPWQELLGDTGGDGRSSMAPVTALPVLTGSLSTGSSLDDQYAAVLAANEAAWKPEAGPAKVEALRAAVSELLGSDGLTRQLLGKRGWFAAAMSGKAVDYSARAIAGPGPDLDFDQCGLPRAIARTLFEPLVAGDLMRSGHADSGAAARKLLGAGDPRADASLERVAREKLVLLHRAPVLHRLGIQAFHPVLTDEAVIRLHPLCLGGFNADFDGDEMEVFLPLSERAQEEARTMLPSANQMSPAWREHIRGPQQDMVLGWYYATAVEPQDEPSREFKSLAAVAAAFDKGEVRVHETVAVADGEARHTTVGRALLNETLPESLRWIEGAVDKRQWRALLARCWSELGPEEAARLADAMVRRGHELATRSGLSIGMTSLPQYSRRLELLAKAWAAADEIAAAVGAGDEADGAAEATADAVGDATADHWVEVAGDFSRRAFEELAADRDGLNPVYLMNHSGARGSHQQLKQHIAMRGLLATPDQRLIGVPCTSSFGSGLSPLEHLAGTFGARKGLADTCLKTASAGFLFKRIMSAVQDVRITEEDCGASGGVAKISVTERPRGPMPAGQRVWGRTAAEDVVLPGEDAPVVRRGDLIDAAQAERIAASGLESVTVRSPLTCRAEGGICRRCYGADLATWELARTGLAVGVLAAHSLGEPLTQLTLRTFYVGALSRRRGEPGSILTGLPRLDELLEAGRSPMASAAGASDERQVLELMLQQEGALATAEYLLREIDGVYCLQGVEIDERHLEVILAQMLGTTFEGQPQILGVSEAARQTRDIVAVATAYDSIPALAQLAAAGEPVALDGIRSCTTFGKVIPALG